MAVQRQRDPICDLKIRDFQIHHILHVTSHHHIFYRPVETARVVVNYEVMRETKFAVMRAYGQLCPHGWSLLGDSCYQLFIDTKTYHEAVLACQNKDGDLAMDKTPAVHNLLASLTSAAGVAAYIGLSDLAGENSFFWADGSHLEDSQEQWDTDEPNNLGNEDCVVLRGNGRWNDLRCSNTRAYICERDNDIPLKCDESDGWYTADSKCFKYYSSQKNWDDAASYCRRIGGDLASINSDPEQEMVANTATAAGVTLWIGLTDKEGNAAGNYGWSDGESYSYVQWATNQPDNSFYTLGGDCGEITSNSDGKWSTAACTSTRAFMCERPEGSCPNGWHLFRGYCYQYNTNQPSTWSKAKFTCEAQGTYLLTDFSAAENNYIVERMSDFSGITVDSVWLGLSDTEIDDSLQWVESSSLGYTNWGSSGSALRTGVDDCAYITTAESDGTWSTGDCDDSRAYICKVVATQPIMPLTPGVAISTCDAGWTLFGDNCYYFEWASKNFDDAEMSCTSKGAHLTSILSEEEQMFLTMRSRMGGVFQWIGLHDIVSESEYSWTDHSDVTYRNWAPNQPDNWRSREDCVHLRSSETQAGLWNDMDGNTNRLASICKKATNEAFARCEAGWLEHGNKCYYFEWSRKNFATAENACSAKGAHLTSINDQDEQDFLSLRAKVGGAQLWIGLHDSSDESSFVWTDGSPYNTNTFSNWAPNQPDDWQNREDCIHMRTGTSAGLWNDKFCDTSLLASVCKKDLIPISGDTVIPLPTPQFNNHCGIGWEYEPISGNCYLFRDWDYKDWYAAREACQLEGGDLASIVSKDEQLYMNARLVLSQEDALFIGGNDFNREGGWGWSDGEGFAYVNWNAGEPNDVNGEDCMEIYTSTDNWNDINCYRQRGYICKKNGYLVTHFTVENNRLEVGTGSLTLSDVFADECAQRCVKMNSFTCHAFNYDRASKKCTFFDTTSSSPMSDANVDYYERQMEVVDPVDPTIPPNYRCADHWSRYGDNCYYILSDTMSYSSAKTSCGNINGVSGGKLASIHDSNENSFIRALANENGATGKVWIGLNDLNDPMSFQWDDATPVDFSEWNHNEPNNYRGRAEDCVEMYSNSYWNDGLCDNNRAAVCKRPRENLPATQFPITPTGCSGSETAYSYYCYSVSSSGNNWQGALTDCRSNGGDLVSVLDRYEQTVLASLLGSEDGSKVWIGLNNRDNQGQYVWSDGSRVSYTNWDYLYPDDTKGRCATSSSGLLAGLWSNMDCSSNLKYMCKRVRTGYTVPPPVTTQSPTQPSNTGCARGWTGYGNNCFRAYTVDSSTKASWQTARDRCVNMGGDLASFHSSEEENYIYANSGSTQSSGYWIGLHDRSTEGGFEWSDGTPVEHTNWNGGEPNDWGSGEDCTEAFFSSRIWNDLYCNRRRNWICKIPKGQTPVTTPEPTSPTPWPSCDNDPDWLKYDTDMGTYCYFFSAGATPAGRNKDWYDANEYCMEAGGYLVSIHSQDEIDFLKTHLARYGYTRPYIGMREYTVEGTYTWSDKSPVDFTLWATDEPNDANGEEQCVQLYSQNGRWNDVNCGKESHFICRKASGATGRVTHPPTSPPVGNCLAGYWRFDNKCYIIYGEDGMKSWYDARTTCRSVEGRDLATIHSRELQAFLSSKMADITFNVYIGLSDTQSGGRYLWTDGSGVDFTNWARGEPNNYGHGDCAEMMFHQERVGLWNDNDCNIANGYICRMDLHPDAAELPADSGDCREGFIQYGKSCFQVIDRTYIYEEAQASCQTLGDDVNLASIASSYEEAFAEAQGYLSGGQNLWIGLTHDMEKETYSFADGHPVWYTFWAENEPSGESNEGCVTLLSTGGWDDTACNLLYKPLCKYSTVPVPTEHPDIPGNCSEGWTAYSSYCYLVVNGVGDNARSWPGANYECEQLGGTLASYHTLQENHKIRNLAAAGSKNIWIGLSRGDSGGFEWIDDSPVDFTNWNTGEPTYEMEPGIEDCVEMLRQTGKWNDLNCWNTRGYVCIMPKSGIPTTVSTAVPTTVPTAVPTTVSPNISRASKAGLSGGRTEPTTGLSGGEVTGIVLGCVLVICLVALIAFFLVSYRSSACKKKAKEPEIPNSVSFNNALYEGGKGSVQVNAYDIDSKA
ncbi:macrophage mannose receptor 1-like [Diadema setosum]|uniref:macrophage mannose receptor 1-like n=1 Tax=Diadema setosum TaxID=31175 RepID=UPI003B3A52D2